MAEDLKLFRSWSSRFALRAVHALKIKGLDYQTQFEDLKNKSAALLEYNPIHHKVPVLLHNGKPICESLVILEYIDEVWQHPPLLPRDPYDKAMARFWAKFGDEKVMLSVWSVVISQGKEQEEAIGKLAENLKFLEEQLRGKRFFGGETIGYLDLALGWMANLISIWEEIIDCQYEMAEELKLYRTWSSPYALRVVHALKIKGVEYETVLEDLTKKSASLLEYNLVHKKVPILLHNGRPIQESLGILEYIDEVWKQSPLLPQDPYEKAMARFWAKFGDEKVYTVPLPSLQDQNYTYEKQVMPSIWSVFISQGKEQEEAIAQAVVNLKFLDEQLKGNKFFGGEAIGYLDLAFGWIGNLISILEDIIDLQKAGQNDQNISF